MKDNIWPHKIWIFSDLLNGSHHHMLYRFLQGHDYLDIFWTNNNCSVEKEYILNKTMAYNIQNRSIKALKKHVIESKFWQNGLNQLWLYLVSCRIWLHSRGWAAGGVPTQPDLSALLHASDQAEGILTSAEPKPEHMVIIIHHYIKHPSILKNNFTCTFFSLNLNITFYKYTYKLLNH